MAGTAPAAVVTSVLRRLATRPTGIVASARWLFLGLALVTLLVVLPAPLATGDLPVRVVGLCAGLLLALSWMYGYLADSFPWPFEVVDTVALMAFGLACPDHSMAIGVAFAAIWCRSFSTSGLRSLVRCGLYVAGLALTVPLWSAVPGRTADYDGQAVFVSFPIMVVTAVVAIQLATELRAREQALRRDGVLVASGSQLLGVTDGPTIRRLAKGASVDLAEATPGLRLVKVTRVGSTLRVDWTIGDCDLPAASLPATVLAGTAELEDAHLLGDVAPLDAAAGVPLRWAVISLNLPNEWLFAGAPRRIFGEAEVAIRSLTNQVALALSNREVHLQLTQQARTDSLTGLSNRISFGNVVSRYLADRGGAHRLQLLFIDLDDFKDVNDLLGHSAGDAILAKVAARIRSRVPAEHVCARLGGDEFAVVLHGSVDDALRIAEQIVHVLSQPFSVAGCTAHLGASVGVAHGEAGIELEALVHRADLAMYAAKAQGKGRVQVFHAQLLRPSPAELVGPQTRDPELAPPSILSAQSR